LLFLFASTATVSWVQVWILLGEAVGPMSYLAAIAMFIVAILLTAIALLLTAGEVFYHG